MLWSVSVIPVRIASALTLKTTKQKTTFWHISQLLYHIRYSHETESNNTYHSTTDCTEQIHVQLSVVITPFEFSISSRSFKGLSRVKQNKEWIPLFQSPASVFGVETNEYKQAGYACFSSQKAIYNSYWNNSRLSEEAKEWKNNKWLDWMGFRWTRKLWTENFVRLKSAGVRK